MSSNKKQNGIKDNNKIMQTLSKMGAMLCNTLNTKEDTTKAEECLIKEMVDNGYKLTVRGADLFLDNCDLDEEASAFYRAIEIRCFTKGLLDA